MAQLVVIKSTGDSVSAEPYLQSVHVPTEQLVENTVKQQAYKLQGHSIKTSQLLYPNKSDFTPGQVVKHKLSNPHLTALNLFVIGADPMSIRWAKTNAAYLKKHHAFGMITNVSTADQTKQAERQTGLTLTPAALTGFAKVVGTHHYPLMVTQGWVLQ